MTNDQLYKFFGRSLVVVHGLVGLPPDSKAWSWFASVSFVIKQCDILQNGSSKENWLTKIKVQQRNKVITLEVKLWSNANGVIEKIADCGI